MKKLDHLFYRRADVLLVARQLLGKLLVTEFSNRRTAGRIVETEAYAGITDKASHASGGRRTVRNEVMYGAGGFAYVYLCYGIHHLFNVVTHNRDTPHAVLIRALEPVEGEDIMAERVHKFPGDRSLTRGPGNLTRAMGIHTRHSGTDLTGNEIYIMDDGLRLSSDQVVASARIGVDYAGDDALLPYRFSIRDNPWVSGKPLRK